MAEETEFTFAHFVDGELLAARVKDFGGRYEPEQIAATAFYLGILSVTGMAQAFRIAGDSHYLMHLMSNIYAGEWLVDLVESGSIDPAKTHDFVIKEHGDHLRLRNVRADGMEDIKSEVPGGIKPMDKETFTNLWGNNA